MIRVGICDDQPQDIEVIHKLLKNYNLLHQDCEFDIYTFTTPLEMLSFITEQGTFEILLLDIYMQGISGIDVAKELRASRDDIAIIFITSSVEHSIDAFGVDAAHYIVKPVNEDMVFQALDKVILGKELRQRKKIIIKTSDGINRLAMNEIVFTKPSKKNYQAIHTMHGETIEVRMTAEELFQLFSSDEHFFKCGAALVLNLQYVRKITKEYILLDTDEKLAFPYRSYQSLKEQFLNLYMNETD